MCCEQACGECSYYQEIYFPRIQFVLQLDLPAAVCQGLDIWGGNKQFADLVGLSEADLIGLGIESLVHEDSLPAVISNIKKRAMGDPGASKRYPLFIKSEKVDKVKVDISVAPLTEPMGAFLVMVDSASPP